jgi:hypothetical protein
MPELSPTTIFWTACFVQLAGLLILAAARSGQRCPDCKWVQGAFFLMMALIGCVAILAFQARSGCWASCGATLAIMAVAATMDFPTAAESGLESAAGR